MTQVNRPSGISAVTFFRLLPRALTTLSVRRELRARRSGTGTTISPERYLPVHEFGAAIDVVDRALRHDVAAVDAGAGADVEHVVGGADRVLVVLDHDHGVAEVAQPLQRFEEPRVVALVQPDRRLVEHVEHAGEAGADLRGEPDALALAARQRAGGAREREIFEPDIDQEFQPLADLLEHAHRDLVLLRRQPLRQLGEPFAGALDRHLGDLADVPLADLHAQRLGLEAEAVAGVARECR